MIKEFRDFILKGNVLDLAIAVIIGAAFGAIVASLVNDIIMPLVGLVLGGTDFSNLFISLDGNSYATLAAAQEAGAATLNYGIFIQTIINFLIIAAVLFMIIKAYNSTQKKEAAAPPAPPAPTNEEKLLTQIRDLLARQR